MENMILFIYLAFEPIYTAPSLANAYTRDNFITSGFALTGGDLFSLPGLRYAIIQGFTKRWGIEVKHFGQNGYKEISVQFHIFKRKSKKHIISEIWQMFQWDISPALLYLEEGGYVHWGGNLILTGEFSLSHLTTRFSLSNFPGYVRYERLQESMEIQEIYKGSDYQILSRLTLFEEKYLNTGFAIKGKLGNIFLSTGISLSPDILTFGMEIPYNRMNFCLGISSHPQLGISEVITVVYE